MGNIKFSQKIIDLFEEFKEKFGFEYEYNNGKSAPYYANYVIMGYIVFQRYVEYDDCMHTVILENLTNEKKDPNFDPKLDIGDWLIFSSRKDDNGDPYYENELQYPLTLSEYKFIERIIQALEAEFATETTP